MPNSIPAPARARIDPRKLRDYALNPAHGWSAIFENST